MRGLGARPAPFAAGHWKSGRVDRLLARMLFRAADPPERYRILERFYRLPEPLIGRFYAGRSTAFDRLRILAGRPPVAVGRAAAALMRNCEERNRDRFGLRRARARHPAAVGGHRHDHRRGARQARRPRLLLARDGFTFDAGPTVHHRSRLPAAAVCG